MGELGVYIFPRAFALPRPTATNAKPNCHTKKVLAKSGPAEKNNSFTTHPSTCPLAKHHYHSILFRPRRSEGTQPLQMAGSSKKASPKSPKRTRQGKAAASETESASKSPKTTRQGKAAASETKSASKSPKTTRQGKATVPETGSGDFNNEDYNIRSPERTKLLTKIKGVIKNAPVSPAFWACCQLADMNCLQILAKSHRRLLLGYQDPLAFIALQCELLGF